MRDTLTTCPFLNVDTSPLELSATEPVPSAAQDRHREAELLLRKQRSTTQDGSLALEAGAIGSRHYGGPE